MALTTGRLDSGPFPLPVVRVSISLSNVAIIFWLYWHLDNLSIAYKRVLLRTIGSIQK
jgi:hypothetical protein